MRPVNTKRIRDLSLELLGINGQNRIAIDLLCGDGDDAQFIASHYQQVYAFESDKEILKQAIANNQKNNIKYIKEDHFNFDSHIAHFDGAFMNLGHLHDDGNTVGTLGGNILRTLKKVITCLNSEGKLIVICYPGSINGSIEATAISEFAGKLNDDEYNVAKIELLNRHHAPFLIVIERL